MTLHNPMHPADAVGVGVPVATATISMLGVQLQDWVYLFTIAVAVTQLIRFCVWAAGFIRKLREKRS
jgi:hypothetical protein